MESGEANGASVATAMPTAEFGQLVTRSQRRLFLLILAQVHNPVEAEEILQDVNVVVWSKAGQFREGTNFLAWASQIATFEILKYRSRQKRSRTLFQSEFLETVAAAAVERADDLEPRRAALAYCLQKLRPADRELVQSRYAGGNTGRRAAELSGRPANSVYQSLGRIRRALWECIQRRLAAEAH